MRKDTKARKQRNTKWLAIDWAIPLSAWFQITRGLDTKPNRKDMQLFLVEWTVENRPKEQPPSYRAMEDAIAHKHMKYYQEKYARLGPVEWHNWRCRITPRYAHRVFKPTFTNSGYTISKSCDRDAELFYTVVSNPKIVDVSAKIIDVAAIQKHTNTTTETTSIGVPPQDPISLHPIHPKFYS